MSSKKILIVVANPSISTTLGCPVGFWAAELIHPYHVFTQAGCQAQKLKANFITKQAFSPHEVRDGNLITGQQQNSGHETAKLVLEALDLTP